MATSRIPKNIFVIGGTGGVGSRVVETLLEKRQFNLKLLVRKSAWDKKGQLLQNWRDAGAQFVEGDISDLGFLTEAMKGSDTVLSVLGGDGLFSGHQPHIHRAAKAAGVRRIIPAEFGPDVNDESDIFFGEKTKLRKEIINSGLEYTFIFPGTFMEYFFSEVFGFNLKEGKLVIPGDGNKPLSLTTIPDTARFVAEILADAATINQRVYVCADTLTYHQAARLVEQEAPELLPAQNGRLQITHQPLEEISKIVADQSGGFNNRVMYNFRRVLLTTNQAYDEKITYHPRTFKPTTAKEYVTSMKKKF
jgi:uncharacterized protein YbjT (DUF2867 family)